MYGTKLCLGTMDFAPTITEEIRLIAEAGFDGFFTGWAKDIPLDEWRRTADEYGMLWQSIHAPFGRAAAMWTDGDNADAAVGELVDCAQDCAKVGVPIMIVHSFIGFDEHTPNEYGLENFGRVVDEAERLGVKIAFENTEGEEYLSALMKHFADRGNVGFCLDTGHEMCYNFSKDMLALYGGRLIATHLNDNLGIRDYDGRITWHDDLHMLPFDGIADWDDAAKRIAHTGFDDCLTFELTRRSKPNRRENDVYMKMTAEEYLTEAYKRACRVAALVTKHRQTK